MNAKLPAHAIDHQGVECSLYERLWKARGAPLLAAEDGIFLRIPHTVVYRQSAPCGWYFTSKSCQLSRRRRGRLCNDEILSAFGGGSYEPAAIWRQQSRNEKGKLVYEEVVLASVDLEAFLRSEKVTDGVLQKFVRPSGQNMRIFRATWTRHICYIELVEKEAQISDKRTSLRQRFSFSNERHTRSRLVRNASYNGRLIEFACDSIVRKLEAYSVENEGGVSVENAIFNFAMSNGNIFLLYSTFLQFEGTCDCTEKYSSGNDISLARTDVQWGLARDPFTYAEYSEDNYKCKAEKHRAERCESGSDDQARAYRMAHAVFDILLRKEYSGAYALNDTAKQFLHDSDIEEIDVVSLQKVLRLFQIDLSDIEANQCLQVLGVGTCPSPHDFEKRLIHWKREGVSRPQEKPRTLPSSLKRACGKYQKTLASIF